MEAEKISAEQRGKTDGQSCPFSVSAVKGFILLGLTVIFFRTEFTQIISAALVDSNYVQTLLFPVFIGLLIYLRRDRFRGLGGRGSVLGVLFIIFGILMYGITTWPYSYGLARQYALVPVLAGIAIVSFGRRVLVPAIPLLLLFLLAIPIGSRFYAKLIIRPETTTINMTSKILDALPSIESHAEGNDLKFQRGGRQGVVGLGESNRGARLFFLYAVIGLFTLYSEKRTVIRRLIVLAISLPIVLFCNFFRFFCWSLVLIYGKFSIETPLPKIISTILSICLCYILFLLFSSARLKLFVDNDSKDYLEDSCHAT